MELKTNQLPAWFRNYMLTDLQSSAAEQKISAKDADTIEAVRLQYEQLKNKR